MAMASRGDDMSESWMDASIRLHLREVASERMRQDEEDDDSGIQPIAPPLLLAEIISSSFELPDIDRADAHYSIDPDLSMEPSAIDTDVSEDSNEYSYDKRNGNGNGNGKGKGNRAYVEEDEASSNSDDTEKRRGQYASNKYDESPISEFIVTRTSLPYTIEHNELTLSWTSLINTNQRALDEGNTEKVEETNFTMTFQTLQEARAACHAFAPPRMHSFADSPKCHVCNKNFNKILRRASHCKNCGVCVCSSCSINWPSCMFPVSYRFNKRKRYYRVCVACDWLNTAFRQALLLGNIDKAKALESSGNINTRTPFANMRGESCYPVHCAVLGGNVNSLKWLVDELHCPIASRRRKSLMDAGSGILAIIGNEEIVTARGKSVLDLAMEATELEILRYLVVQKNLNIYQCKNLRVVLKTLNAALKHIPVHLNLGPNDWGGI